MINHLLFSSKLRQIDLTVKPQLLKVGRLMAILFKRKRKLEKISFGYYQKWHFNNAYLFVDFEFKNAVWFRIGKYKSYDFSKQVVLDIENIQKDIILFEVFGFFQKQDYEIKLNKENRINKQSFKTKINNINSVTLGQQKTATRIPKIGLHTSYLNSTFETISVKQQNIQLDYKPFKIQNYI